MISLKEFVGALFKDIQPLSNFDIIRIRKKLKIVNFKGCFMRDEIGNLDADSNNDECFIMNLDDSNSFGTHWVAVNIAGATGISDAGATGISDAGATSISDAGATGISDAGATGISDAGATGISDVSSTTYYFDSFGLPPTTEIKEYCKEPRYYNSFVFQKPNEVICGQLCLYFLYRMRKCNKDFCTVLDEIYKSRVTE